MKKVLLVSTIALMLGGCTEEKAKYLEEPKTLGMDYVTEYQYKVISKDTQGYYHARGTDHTGMAVFLSSDVKFSKKINIGDKVIISFDKYGENPIVEKN